MSSETSPKRLAFFERYLTVWVFLCMVVGVALGKLAPQITADLGKVEFVAGSSVSVPDPVIGDGLATMPAFADVILGSSGDQVLVALS